MQKRVSEESDAMICQNLGGLSLAGHFPWGNHIVY